MLFSSDIKKAAQILTNGGLVAFPTETVYGLGANARNQNAIAKIFTVKQRPKTHPLIVHIGDVSQLGLWAKAVPAIAYTLAELFWPGPLTFVLKKQDEVLDIVTGGQDTIALRMPQHPIALALLQEVGSGLAAPSANKFTHISPTTAQAVYEELGDEVDMIIDGGACMVGLESTILDLSGDVPTILRPGMISAEMISDVLQIELSIKNKSNINVPGMHHLHYAPKTPAVLFKDEAALRLLLHSANRIGFLIHSKELEAYLASLKGPKVVSNITGDPNIYAQKLYHALRQLDQQQFDLILIEAVPETFEWCAIRDRLLRSCASAFQK